MHVLLVLVLIGANGPKETTVEQLSLAECWARAQAVIERAEPAKMSDAGFPGYGAGCIVVNDPSQNAGR